MKKEIYTENFSNNAFLVVLNSPWSTGKSSIYIVTCGSSTPPVLISFGGTSADEAYPRLGYTDSGRIWVSWKGDMTASLHANMFKLF